MIKDIDKAIEENDYETMLQWAKQYDNEYYWENKLRVQ